MTPAQHAKTTLLIDGLTQSKPGQTANAHPLTARLAAAIERRGFPVRTQATSQMTCHHCIGCFTCWVHTPGRCVFSDDGESIIGDILSCSSLLYITPIHFGSCSASTKRQVERQLPIALPFFKRYKGEIHHIDRYPNSKDRFLCIGVATPTTTEDDIAAFRRLFERNQMNFDFPISELLIITHPENESTVDTQFERALDRVYQKESPSFRHTTPNSSAAEILQKDLPWLAPDETKDTPTNSVKRHALLWLGSPRHPSNSAELAHALGQEMIARGWTITPYSSPELLHSPEVFARFVADIQGTDLVILSFPLYVDGVPSVTLEVMERLADHFSKTNTRGHATFMSMCNCGFPEAHQNLSALAIARNFAISLGFSWAGALAMGMGEAIGRKPLIQTGRLTAHIREALHLTAKSLAAGHPVPKESVQLMARPLMPSWIYLTFGNLHWYLSSWKILLKGKSLRARPFEPASTP